MHSHPASPAAAPSLDGRGGLFSRSSRRHGGGGSSERSGSARGWRESTVEGEQGCECLPPPPHPCSGSASFPSPFSPFCSDISLLYLPPFIWHRITSHPPQAHTQIRVLSASVSLSRSLIAHLTTTHHHPQTTNYAITPPHHHTNTHHTSHTSHRTPHTTVPPRKTPPHHAPSHHKILYNARHTAHTTPHHHTTPSHTTKAHNHTTPPYHSTTLPLHHAAYSTQRTHAPHSHLAA